MPIRVAKKFYTSGSTTTLVQYTADALQDTVEAGIYELRQSMTGLYLYRVAKSYELPKLYGNIVKRANKIMNTFTSRTASTGVLLSGDKGTGKSLLSMLVANLSVHEGNPVILINQAFHGSEFEELMNAIPNAVLIFDEFAKVYANSKDGDDKPQERLLGFFDGAGAKKRLMIFTENKTVGINEFLINRPGRIFYHYKYSKLTPDVIQEYCLEKNVKSGDTQYLQNYAITASEFSFDILKAIVEELHRYPEESIKELVLDLNITSTNSTKSIQILSIMDKQGNPYSLFEHDGLLNITFRENEYITIVPKDPEVLKKVMLNATSSLEEYLKDNPDEADTIFVKDYLQDLNISLGHSVLTVKNGVTFIKSKDDFIIGYKEVDKPLTNYYGLMGDY